MLGHLKRSAKPDSFNRAGSSSDGSMTKDPFHSSDDDRDSDYVLPTKRMKTAPQPNLKPSNARGKNKTKKLSNKKEHLTAAQRIARLNRKSEQFNKISQARNDLNPTEMNGRSADPSVNLDDMFDMEKGNDTEVIMCDKSNDFITGQKIDALSCKNEAANSAIIDGYHDFANSSMIFVPSTPQASHEYSDLVQMIQQMRDQITDLAHDITILRKQVARVEMKSTPMCSFGNSSRPGSSNSLIDPDMLFDFEGTLSREGLPLKTCAEINQFELKLKGDEYRTKLITFLCVLNGESGTKKGSKIIKQLFDAIIDGEIKTSFSWTGKSATGKNKIAFSEYKEIINLIYAVVRHADGQYTMNDCEHDLTYKVLKYAAVKK